MQENSIHFNRRQFLAGAAALTAALPFASSVLAQAKTKITTGFGWIANVEHANYWRALDAGYFAEEGIDAQYLAGGPGLPSSLVNLAAGQLQIAGAEWGPVSSAIDKGNDFVVIGFGFPVSPSAVLSLAKNPVKTPADLVGKRILLQSPSSKTIIDTILTDAGLPLDYEMVPTGFSPEPLLSGDGDVFLCFATNQPITLEQMGLTKDTDFFVTLLSDLGYKIPGATMTVSRAFLEANRPALVGHLKALIRGYRANAADPTVAPKLVVDKYGVDLGLDLAQQTRQNELQIPLMTASGSDQPFLFDIEPSRQALLAVAAAAGVEGQIDIDKAIDLSLLKEALAAA